ncbi:hypothetical protein CcCBS67573_g08684 [Chytriomyces confervae]|uniref:Protein kinase domain-containing protein n=1 Tax=Chytriomyces confervae TaxID=246404 RepID=A0A507EJ83_9FUNG|nr:hypothetical protein CcCBS67573_g08684 [Chytriomyces confervae]
MTLIQIQLLNTERTKTIEGNLKMPQGFHLESDKDYHNDSQITIDKLLEHAWVKAEVDFYQYVHSLTVAPEKVVQLDHPNIIKYIDHVVEPPKYGLLIMAVYGRDWKGLGILATKPTNQYAWPASAGNTLENMPEEYLVEILYHCKYPEDNSIEDMPKDYSVEPGKWRLMAC